ncbi:GNAT family N-acetyltransferase [Corynebacterium anserum]|uniref:GNAT family N-acetyltransferase n=1 Tax=Corynebacterium anserum TaxID=2684406 RepID=A0A7G7YM53_9CORY|nr:GNAT family N-acetyltransferase [Corynebacterium anserum]MBC2681243.1 GNAT family N-acetyltransferase [Corynebacterium anserum]QNH95573.1 GNAT family N-acetyltransferase [Corynebacterium anserum]
MSTSQDGNSTNDFGNPGEKNQVSFRPALEADRPFLEELFHEIDTWGEDRPLSENFHNDREKYVGQWEESMGGVIAELNGQRVGATWLLELPQERCGSGYISEDIPELAISMVRGKTGHGLGRMLLKTALEVALDKGKPGVSLAVDKGNDRAYHVYETLGFKEVDYNHDTDCHVMLYDFQDHNNQTNVLGSITHDS